MITERSCGAVIYTKDNGQTEYVIVRSRQGFYGFPKGHVEGTETEQETALREVTEEVGLSVDLLPDFRVEDSYLFTWDGEEHFKRVVYYLAEYSGQIPVAQESELSSVHLLSFEEAMSVFQFDNLKQILTKANTFLSSRE